MINFIKKERLCQLFKELVCIDSVSYQERKSADYVKNFLIHLGAEVYEDEAWKYYFNISTNNSGQKKAEPLHDNSITANVDMLSGNLYAYIPGTLPGKPLLFSAHLDTVSPGTGKKAVLDEDNIFRSSGNTVLGADDAAGIAEILEAVRLLKENGINHRSLELFFPIAEEVYGQGSRVFDYGKLRAEEAYVLDLSGSIGIAAIQAPSIISFRIEVKGKAAHAGFAPEDGIHAIGVAAESICKLKLGKIGNDSTRNIGIIHGGTGRNIIPDDVILEGEIRSYSHQKALDLLKETTDIFRKTAKENGAEAVILPEVQIKAYQTEKHSPVVNKYIKACNELAIDVSLERTFGGSDNNNFAEHGIKGIVLSCGMQQVHTKEEYILLQDLYLGTALVMQLMTENG